MNVRFVVLVFVLAVVPSAGMVTLIWYDHGIVAGVFGIWLAAGLTKLIMMAIVDAVDRDMKRWR